MMWRVKFLWTLSIASISVILLGFQTGQQYSSMLFTIVLKRVSIRKGDLPLKPLKTHDAISLAVLASDGCGASTRSH